VPEDGLAAEVAALRGLVEDLAGRLRAAEDQLALYQLVASYGPAVDSGDPATTSALWAEDGVYETEQTGPMVGREGIAAMVVGEGHQGLIHGGCGHVLSMPVVEVRGDQAVLTNHSRLYRKGDEGFDLWLLKANRWEVERTDDGWKVRSRVNLTLDGRPGGRELLGRAHQP
jgi:hypothetical protein